MRRIWFLPLVLLVVGACSGSGMETTVTSKSGDAKAEALIPGEPQFWPVLPAEYAEVGLLTAGTDQSAYWWSSSGGDARIFRVDQGGQVASWVLTKDPSLASPVSPGGLAVDGDGSVWSGQNMTLLHLDRNSGEVKVVSIPRGSENPLAAQYLPERLKAVQSVADLASSRDAVAVALTNSSSVQIYDKATGGFTEVPLPENNQGKTVAFDSLGRLYVGLIDFKSHLVRHVLVVENQRPSGVVQVPDAAELASDGDGVVAGTLRPSRVAGLTSSLLMPEEQAAKTFAPLDGGLALLGDGRVVGSTIQGLAVFTPGSTEVSEIRLPPVSCTPSGPAPGEGQEAPEVSTCQSRATTAVAAGKLVYFTASGRREIGVVAPS